MWSSTGMVSLPTCTRACSEGARRRVGHHSAAALLQPLPSQHIRKRPYALHSVPMCTTDSNLRAHSLHAPC